MLLIFVIFQAKNDYFVISVRPLGTTRLPPDGVSWKLMFEHFSKTRWTKLNFHYNLTKIMGTLHEGQYTVLIIYCSVRLRMRNIWDTISRENQKNILFSKVFFFENITVYEIKRKNTAEWPQMTIWRKRIACWITKATNTHSEYVILNAFPLQQCLQERARK